MLYAVVLALVQDDVARFAFADNRWPDEDQYTELALFRQRIESYYKGAPALSAARYPLRGVLIVMGSVVFWFCSYWHSC